MTRGPFTPDTVEYAKAEKRDIQSRVKTIKSQSTQFPHCLVQLKVFSQHWNKTFLLTMAVNDDVSFHSKAFMHFQAKMSKPVKCQEKKKNAGKLHVGYHYTDIWLAPNLVMTEH